jgi:hypothetical protein
MLYNVLGIRCQKYRLLKLIGMTITHTSESISSMIQLHRGIADSSVFVNYAVFESPKLLKQAFKNPDFQSKISEYSASTVASPHLFKKVAVPGICVD